MLGPKTCGMMRARVAEIDAADLADLSPFILLPGRIQGAAKVGRARPEDDDADVGRWHPDPCPLVDDPPERGKHDN